MNNNKILPGKDYIGVGCGAMILNKNKEILLVKRSKQSKAEPGMWSRPGGTVEFGETIKKALVREIKEELNIKINIIKFLEYFNNIDLKNHKHWVTFGFLAKIKSGKVKNMEPGKIDQIKWFALDNLPKNLTSYTKNGIRAYLQG
jgi:8-oxo-dGTP diphosphatase